MNSTSPQPIPQVPPIESLAPPLPEEAKSESKSAVAAQPVLSVPPKDGSWVPVEVQGVESSLRTDINPNGGRPNIDNDIVKTADTADASPALINRVMKQRSSVLPQSAHVQKDNTLAIFVTLCLVVVAIACGIYFVADRETQIQTETPEHIASASINQLPPPAASLQSTPVAPAVAPSAPNPEFGKPIAKPASSGPKSTSVSSTPSLKQDKTSNLIAQSQIKLSRMQYIEAEYSARQATELKPASTDAWLALGRALYAQGRYDEAKQAFKTCIKRNAQSKAARTAGDFIADMPALGQTK